MNKELIINSAPQGVEIALLEDKKLVELHNEKADASFAVGDLYLGKVRKLIPGLNAAFVDVGFEKDAFLHYTDLSPYAKSLLKFTQQSIADTAGSFDFGKFEVEAEIVKPILRGSEGLKQVYKFCTIFREYAKVNESTGVHVHVDAADFKNGDTAAERRPGRRRD